MLSTTRQKSSGFVDSTVFAKDAPIVAAAAHTHADCLITLDRVHLFAKRDEIQATFGILVITPGEAMARR